MAAPKQPYILGQARFSWLAMILFLIDRELVPVGHTMCMIELAVFSQL